MIYLKSSTARGWGWSLEGAVGGALRLEHLEDTGSALLCLI